jgi:uncharacterized protein (DUF2132 family)
MEQKNNPLHGFTLEQILNWLLEHKGWDYMADQVRINCFLKDPTIASSLKFLRRTPWARTRVETIFINEQQKYDRKNN